MNLFFFAKISVLWIYLFKGVRTLKFLHWLKEEIVGVIPAVVYFCIVLNLIYFTAGLTLKPGVPRYFSHLAVTLGALVIGKIMLVINSFSFINAFPNKPLIYNILWKFSIYIFCIVLLWLTHNFLHFYFSFHDGFIALSILEMELSSPIFWSSLIWVLITFLCYVIFSDLARKIGYKKMWCIFFGPV